MKLRRQCLVLMMGLLTAGPGVTSPGAPTDNSDGGGGSGANNQKKIVMYLLRLGQYFGYNLDTDPKEKKQSISEEFLAVTSDLVVKKDQFQRMIYEFLGAIPASQVPVGEAATPFVPTNNPYSSINQWANKSFPNYSSVSKNGVSVSPLIDQAEYQADPVSQAVLDILGTPSSSYCFTPDGTAWMDKCSYLSTSPTALNNNEVTNYVIGAVPSGNPGGDVMATGLPSRDRYLTYDYNRPLLGQLNSNSLLGPLMYSMEEKSSTSSGSVGGGVSLTAQNQAQQALNFIRYATNAVLPLALSDAKDYDELYLQAIDKNPSIDRFKAQSILSTYLASLRIYAAQSSVGISNMYEMLAKRMPQGQEGAQKQGQEPSTAALEEFKMATWRLFNPSKSQDQDDKNATWAGQLNTASSATVQKEIAVLLAEINYQLYLSRQQQERMLLTNSLLLMLNLQNAQPNLGTLMAKAKR